MKGQILFIKSGVFLYFLIIFNSFVANAQSYHSFIHDLAVWVELEATGACDPGNNCVQFYETIWIMSGDTLINNLEYKKLYFEVVAYGENIGAWGCWLQPFWTDGVFWQQYLFGFIREDSTKKVFLIANPEVTPPVMCAVTDFSAEKILYDFDLHVGDTVSWKPFNNVVTDIDSVLAPNGAFLRRISFGSAEFGWTEGLGSGIAFFGSYMPQPFECGCYLECAAASELSLPGTLLCNFPVGITDPIFTNKLSAYPNPAKNTITLGGTKPNEVVYVSNLMGEIVMEQTVGANVTLNIQSLIPGIYFLRTTSGAMGSFVKQ